MTETTKQALDVVRNASGSMLGDEAYLAACEYLVEHRDELPARVFINLPGGVSANKDPRWDKVKEGSDERCNCGNERVILPLNPRTEYVASVQQIVIALDDEVYLKPVGGDKASTYVKLWIEEASLAFMKEPFAPFVLSADLFSTPAFGLQLIADTMKERSEEPVMWNPEGENMIPMFAINAVDVENNTATITLDEAVEAFDPDTYEDEHACSEAS